jgi:hypothetical protein
MTAPGIASMRRWATSSLAVGAAAALLLIAQAALSGQPWMASYLFAWLFVLGISLGSMGLVIVHNLTAGGWGQAGSAVFQAALRTLPATALLALPLLFRLPDLYAWMNPGSAAAAEQGRAWYLNVPFFCLRAVVYFAIWLWLAWLLRDDRPVQQAARRQLVASAGFVVFALTTTFAAVDWMMSLLPQWHSTEFGLLVVVAQVLSALCAAIIGAALTGGHPDEQGRRRFHDLGKLLLALVLLWAYLALMQYLIMWIEDLPDDIAWYLPRTQTSWGGVALFVVVAQFALPFLALLSRNAKRRPPVLAAVAALVLLGSLADTFWLIVPTFRPGGFEILWSDVFALLAVGGIWLGLLIRAIQAGPAFVPDGAAAGKAARSAKSGVIADHA